MACGLGFTFVPTLSSSHDGPEDLGSTIDTLFLLILHHLLLQPGVHIVLVHVPYGDGSQVCLNLNTIFENSIMPIVIGFRVKLKATILLIAKIYVH